MHFVQFFCATHIIALKNDGRAEASLRMASPVPAVAIVGMTSF
jgi:hypothetical protein